MLENEVGYIYHRLARLDRIMSSTVSINCKVCCRITGLHPLKSIVFCWILYFKVCFPAKQPSDVCSIFSGPIAIHIYFHCWGHASNFIKAMVRLGKIGFISSPSPSALHPRTLRLLFRQEVWYSKYVGKFEISNAKKDNTVIDERQGKDGHKTCSEIVYLVNLLHGWRCCTFGGSRRLDVFNRGLILIVNVKTETTER